MCPGCHGCPGGELAVHQRAAGPWDRKIQADECHQLRRRPLGVSTGVTGGGVWTVPWMGSRCQTGRAGKQVGPGECSTRERPGNAAGTKGGPRAGCATRGSWGAGGRKCVRTEGCSFLLVREGQRGPGGEAWAGVSGRPETPRAPPVLELARELRSRVRPFVQACSHLTPRWGSSRERSGLSGWRSLCGQ